MMPSKSLSSAVNFSGCNQTSVKFNSLELSVIYDVISWSDSLNMMKKTLNWHFQLSTSVVVAGFSVSCHNRKVFSLFFLDFSLYFCFMASSVALWFSAVSHCESCPWLISPVLPCSLLSTVLVFLCLCLLFVSSWSPCRFRLVFLKCESPLVTWHLHLNVN